MADTANISQIVIETVSEGLPAVNVSQIVIETVSKDVTGWTHNISGIVPASINGVAVANIASINGV